MSRSARLCRWLPALVMMGIIFYFSSQTGDNLQAMFPMLDNLDWSHLVAYFLLGFSFWFALSGYGLKELKRQASAVLLSLLYSVTDEVHQFFVPGRDPDLFDLANDLVGAVLAMVMVQVWQRFRQKQIFVKKSAGYCPADDE